MAHLTEMKTVAARKEYIQGLLRGDGVISDEDEQKLREIFQENYDPPTGEEKFQDDEIEKFFLSIHPTYRTYCIHILLADGSISTMSHNNLKKNLNAAPNNSTQRKAFRSAINNQIKEFSEPEKEVDHDPPFYITRDKFLQEKNIAMKHVKVVYDKDERVYKLEDKKLESDWIEYHKSEYISGNGKLEAVTREENRRRQMDHFSKNRNTSDSSATAAAGSKN